MILLPAIDIRAGRPVRLEQGDFAREKAYGEDPLATARSFVEQGATMLHVVDLDGARSGEPKNLEWVEAIAGSLDVRVQYGGGLRSLEALEAACAAGADRVVLGTAAYRDRPLLREALRRFGERVLVALDVRDGELAIAGWRERSSATPEEAIELMQAHGVGGFVYTSVARDGMLEGPDLEEVRRAGSAIGGRFVYSGGVGSLDDLMALRELGIGNLEGVVCGKALYEGRFTFAEGRATLERPTAVDG